MTWWELLERKEEVRDPYLEQLRQQMAESKAQGLAEGKAQGLVEGKAQGLAEGQRSALLRLLRARFQVVPSVAEQAMLACTDLDQLSRWLDAAISAVTLNDFLDATGLPRDK